MFKKGQSGNPGGRPREDRELREACRAKTEKAIKALERILDNKKSPAAAIVSAATALLDRGYGKPAQSIAMNLTDHRYVVSQFTDEELQEIANGKALPIEQKEQQWAAEYCEEKDDAKTH